MLKKIVREGEAQKQPPPHLEKKVAKRNPHSEKVTIAPLPMGAGRPHWKIKKIFFFVIFLAFLLLFLHVEAFSATFMRGLFYFMGGLF